jgi:hypothetical protein
MKNSRILLSALIVSALVLSPILPRAHADLVNVKWVNTSFSGFDPYYSMTVSAYQTGSAATLYAPVTQSNGFGGSYINVTAAKLMMDWNGNYTATGLPIKITLNNWALVTITFTVPATNIASNLWIHTGILTVNYTTPAAPGTHQFVENPVPTFAVYSSDQASAMSIMQQLTALTPSFGTACGGLGSSGFKTAAGSSACQQAVQQLALGRSLYAQGNFTASNTAMKNALNSWNSAISADSGAGANLDLSATLGAYGVLLLGIGGVIGGVALFIYAWKRPKELRALAAGATH